MATFKLRENSLSAQTGLTVRLYALPGSSIVNGAGGDTLSETASSDGEFTATVAESLSGLHYYGVYKSSVCIAAGQVYCSGDTWVADNNTSLTVLPVSATVASRVTGTAITLYTGEVTTVAVAVVDSAGAAVSMIGLTLELVFESGSTEVVIADAAITKTATSFSFTSTSALTTAERVWKWALRKTSDESVLVTGTLEVAYAANN